MDGLNLIRRRSAQFAQATAILLYGLAALLLLERFGWLAVVPGDAPFPSARLARAAVAAAPEVLYLVALGWTRVALTELAAGHLFAMVVTKALQRVGTLMLTASLLSILLLPSALAWFGQAPGYLIAYDVSQAVIGAVGLTLGLIGRLLQQAAAIQSELDGIF